MCQITFNSNYVRKRILEHLYIEEFCKDLVSNERTDTCTEYIVIHQVLQHFNFVSLIFI